MQHEFRATGNGALNEVTAFPHIGVKIRQVSLHLSGAVNESIAVTIDNIHGATYDVLLNTTALGSDQDYVFTPDEEIRLSKGSQIRVQLTNAAAVTWGLEIIGES